MRAWSVESIDLSQGAVMADNTPLWWQHPAGRPATGLARQLVFVTDVDAALLDPDTRSLGEERAALDFLAAHGIPLVINSSRTRAEIERIRRALRLNAPFISEHGSALFIPHGSFPFVPAQAQPVVGGHAIEFGRRYHDIVEVLRAASRELGVDIVSFAELTIEDVARQFGVSSIEAQLAKLREYTELFRVLDANEATRSHLMKALRRQGLRCWPLGTHLLATATQNRADSLETLKALWRRAWGEPLIVGFADSEDDIGWLQRTDVAVFVPPDRTQVPPRVLRKLPTVHLTRSPGRAGWSEAVFEFMGSLLDERPSRPRITETVQDVHRADELAAQELTGNAPASRSRRGTLPFSAEGRLPKRQAIDCGD
jgi:mannosyl-3-phosphoglycerate phosphatase